MSSTMHRIYQQLPNVQIGRARQQSNIAKSVAGRGETPGHRLPDNCDDTAEETGVQKAAWDGK